MSRPRASSLLRASSRPRASSMLRASSVFLVSCVVLASGCGTSDESASSAPRSGTREGVTGDITVSAAASLKESFSKIAADFESENPGSSVTINFGSSGDLATQIKGGAPVDVAAFAAESNMSALADAGLLDRPAEVFATNELVIVTKPGNPDGVKGLADLTDVGVVALCAETAPCGRYAAEILADAAVVLPADRVTLGQDVRSTLAAVTQGDAAAGIVYETDARAAGTAVSAVAIPEEDNAVASYPIAVLRSTSEPVAARAFGAFVLGPSAQAVLREAGFGPP